MDRLKERLLYSLFEMSLTSSKKNPKLEFHEEALKYLALIRESKKYLIHQHLQSFVKEQYLQSYGLGNEDMREVQVYPINLSSDIDEHRVLNLSIRRAILFYLYTGYLEKNNRLNYLSMNNLSNILQRPPEIIIRNAEYLKSVYLINPPRFGGTDMLCALSEGGIQECDDLNQMWDSYFELSFEMNQSESELDEEEMSKEEYITETIDKDRSKKVFVIHGRNEDARKALFSFLRSIGLEPLEWNQVINETQKGSPFIGEILDKAFQTVQAVIVLVTGDELSILRKRYSQSNDKPEILSPQARPNVLFESGMAFGRNPENTIIVELDETRDFSDISGRHIIKLDNSAQKRKDLVDRLETIGCFVDIEGKKDWLNEGDFEAAVLPELSKDDLYEELSYSLEKLGLSKEDWEANEKTGADIYEKLEEDHEKILLFLSNAGASEIYAGTIASALGVNQTRIEHYLDVLMDMDYVANILAVGTNPKYFIAARGKAYLVKHNLV